MIPLMRESEDLIFLWAFRTEDTGEGRREWTRTLLYIRNLREVTR